MINYRLFTSAILSVVLLSWGCSTDENPSGPDNDISLVGNWTMTRMISEYQGEIDTLTASQIELMDIVWSLKIEDDGTIEQITNMSGPLITMPGTWSTAANQLTMILTGPSGEPATLVYEYVIDGNILKLNWSLSGGSILNAEFTKQ